MRLHRSALVATLLLAPLALAAQAAPHTPRQLTADDYAQAERMLGQATFGLVHGTASQVTWLPDGRFW